MADDKDSFVFYGSFLKAIELMPAEEQLEAYKAIAYYGLNGNEVELSSLAAKMVFIMAKPQIDANKKRRKDGKKGGRPANKPVVIAENENEEPVVIAENENEEPVVIAENEDEEPVVIAENEDEEPVVIAENENEEPVVIENENQWFENKKPNVNVNVNVNDNVNDNVNEKDKNINICATAPHDGDSLDDFGEVAAAEQKTPVDAGVLSVQKNDIQAERFSAFWAAYPKKTAKKEAEKAWRKIRPDRELFYKIMNAITEAKASEQWRKDHGQYIPNPTTWLNQGRWDDEYKPPDVEPLKSGQAGGCMNNFSTSHNNTDWSILEE